jgi:hypothetical protein
MCHKGVIITFENVATLNHSPDNVDGLLPSGPVVFCFLALNERVNENFWKKGKDATSKGFSILANSFSRLRLEAIYQEDMIRRNNNGDRNILTYTLRISARLVPPVAPIPPSPEASVGVGEATPARLGGLERTLGPVFPRLVVRARAVTLGPGVDAGPFESGGVFPNNARLGGTYSFFPPD